MSDSNNPNATFKVKGSPLDPVLKTILGKIFGSGIVGIIDDPDGIKIYFDDNTEKVFPPHPLIKD